ncbi:hypothetical protein IU449_19385 [Nocardia higoensis]|uniref:Ava_C0101 and related proteins n=1 Tax=Nocardia higoensis TaxID=228599 RepID=A0ABS0DE12_9NOCA|nr:DUF5996 family protein [Nocardia higoensis]MBF6356681.1 hypothetical protein [Nocardia higoensis]
MTESAVPESPAVDTAELLPAIPLESWRPTKETLHRFAQVVGKVALEKGIRRNHWWHMTFRLTARGWTTVPLGDPRVGPVFTCAFDFFDHVLRIATDEGVQVEFDLPGKSVAAFYTDVMGGLGDLGIDLVMHQPHPFDLPDAGRWFEEDTEHADYDPDKVCRAFTVQSRVGRILEEFSAGFSGKVSPVHLFWHTFDLAVQRFSERRVDMPTTVDPVTREAYSREVISAGFWFGDDKVPEPTFYSYVAPEPAGLTDRPLRPEGARWVPSGSGHSAYYAYDAARATGDPVGAALEFFETVYTEGSALAGWDADALACPGGITDPVLEQRMREHRRS